MAKRIRYAAGQVTGGNGIRNDETGELTSAYMRRSTRVHVDERSTDIRAEVVEESYMFKTKLRVPRTGVMVVGVGGNNGSTLAAGLIANRAKIQWVTEKGTHSANWLGSTAMMGTVKLGETSDLQSIHVPIKSLLPMLSPDDLVIGGWDISAMNMVDAMARAQVLPIQVQQLVAPEMAKIPIFPASFSQSFVASNQSLRANHCLSGSKQVQLDQLRQHIRDFKNDHKLEEVIVFWSANTERLSTHSPDVHSSRSNLLKAVADNREELAPSLLYAIAACLEGCSFLNGSPQNTFCRGLIELAKQQGVYLVGDDLKTGQTKLKSVMADFLISTGLKPTSMVSYNHLGNNDGLNLSAEDQFRSKELSKSSVVDDMIEANPLIFPEKNLDHLIVIKYVESVGDSKRALDEYIARIFMDGQQTFVIHNTCEDSLLAVPIMLDLILFTELLQRIRVSRVKDGNTSAEPQYVQFHPLLSLLSAFVKAPAVPDHAPVVNGLFNQREGLLDFLKVVAGFSASDYVAMPHRLLADESLTME